MRLIVCAALVWTGIASAETWRGLTVAPEHRCSLYRAGDYSYPQSVEPMIVAQIGKVYGPYTGRCFASRSETDIEHMVARSEAHDSGLCAAAAETRRRFAQDLLNLTMAGPRVNRYQKSAHDAADWLPPENKCWFAARVVAVRRKYSLTIDRREADALERVLSACTSTEMVVGECAPVAAPPARRLSEPTGDPLDLYDDNGNGRDHLRRSAAARDRARAAQPPGLPLHEGRRRRRRGLRIADGSL